VALAKVFNVDSASTTGITIGSTTPGTEFVLMYGAVNAGTEFNISAIRVGTYSGSSASYPSNGTITFRLRKFTGGVLPAGGSAGTGTAQPIGQSTNSAVSSWYYTTLANATATVGTPGAIVWEQTIPCTAGANWGEWFTPGFEINLGAAGAGSLALTYTYGAAGTSSAVNLMAGLVISE
jgi:hypothetical protein